MLIVGYVTGSEHANTPITALGDKDEDILLNIALDGVVFIQSCTVPIKVIGNKKRARHPLVSLPVVVVVVAPLRVAVVDDLDLGDSNR